MPLTADKLSRTFAALADPTRRELLRKLAVKECSVNELAQPFSMTLPAISKHLKVLETAGLIHKSRRKQFRPCRIEPQRLKDAADWIDQYRRFWEESFDRLDKYLRTLEPEKTMPTTTEKTIELVLVRTLPASRERVYRAWTDPADLRQWCAPHGFVVTHASGEARVGGAWRSCMKSPEGVDHWVGGEYRELVPGQRLAFTHRWDTPEGTPGHETVVTIDLEDAPNGQTLMTFRQTGFKSVQSRDGHEGGWTQAFERLAARVGS